MNQPTSAIPLFEDSIPKILMSRGEVLVSTVLINLLGLALPLALLQVYDRIIPNQSVSTLSLLVVGVGIAVLLEALMRLSRSYVMGRVGAKFEYTAGCAAFEHMLASDIGAFERTGSGVHTERFGALNQLRDFYSGQAVLTLLDLPFALLFLGLIFTLGGSVVVIPVALSVVFFLGTLALGRRLEARMDEQLEKEEDRYSYIIGVLNGIHTVKSMAFENLLQRRSERLQESKINAGLKVDELASLMTDMGHLLTQVCIVTVVAYGGALVIDGTLTIGALAACTLLAGRALQPLNGVIGFWTRFQSIKNARKRFRTIFDMPLDRDLKDDVNHDRLNIEGEITLHDVTFKFTDDGETVLDGVNLHISPGEIIGIAGPNGSGKSVLLTLIRGLIQPTTGEVFIDGKPLLKSGPARLHGQVAYLPQREALYRGTILENITTFRPELKEQAKVIAEMVGLKAVIGKMPLGYQTQVGAGAGDLLPRGVAQRIALARVLFDRPKIMLFDEANSAMDDDGDSYLRDILHRLKDHTTCIVVSHRPSILRLTDRIYHMNNGRLDDDPHRPEGAKDRPEGDKK
ncbi:MAG: peptidase domain-containing ABC transporter [Rhodospirillaceae bacterium]